MMAWGIYVVCLGGWERVYVWRQWVCASLYVEGGREMRKDVVGKFARVGDWLDEGCEVSVFWDKVVALIFGVVSRGWYWAGGRGGGVFMMVFLRMTCVF